MASYGNVINVLTQCRSNTHCQFTFSSEINAFSFTFKDNVRNIALLFIILYIFGIFFSLANNFYISLEDELLILHTTCKQFNSSKINLKILNVKSQKNDLGRLKQALRISHLSVTLYGAHARTVVERILRLAC